MNSIRINRRGLLLGVCLLALCLAGAARGDVLPVAGDASGLCYLRYDADGKRFDVLLRGTADPAGLLRRAVEKLSGRVAGGGLALCEGRPWLVFEDGTVNSLRLAKDWQGLPAGYEPVNEAALPQGLTLRSLVANRAGPWVLVRAADPTLRAAIDAGNWGAVMRVPPAAPQTQPAVTGAGGVVEDRLLRLGGKGWAHFPLPPDYPAGATAWLVMLGPGDDFPLLLVAPPAPSESQVIRTYRFIPAAATQAAATQPATHPASVAATIPGVTTAPAEVPAGDWARLTEHPFPQAATAQVMTVQRQMIVAVPQLGDGKIAVQLSVLRPESKGALPIATLRLDLPPGKTGWAVAPMGTVAALLAAPSSAELQWTGADLAGRITPPAELKDDLILPLAAMAWNLLFIGAMIVDTVLMFLCWRRDALVLRPTLPRELAVGGVGSRALAGIIDLAPCIGVALLVFPGMGPMILFPWVRPPGGWETLVPPLVVIALFVLHTTLSEIFTGRTLGKALLDLRVTNLRGQNPDVWQALGRGLTKALDLLFPPMLIMPLLSPTHQRLGDLVGRTVVVGPAPEPPDQGAEEDDQEPEE